MSANSFYPSYSFGSLSPVLLYAQSAVIPIYNSFNCNLGAFAETEWIGLKIAELLGLSQTRVNRTHKQRLSYNG